MTSEGSEVLTIVQTEAPKPVLSVSLRRMNGEEVEDFLFEMLPGERIFVLGANGTGKSALLHKLFRDGGAMAARVGAQRFIGFQTGAIDMTAHSRERVKTQQLASHTGPEARYYESRNIGENRVSAALFDLVNAEVQRAQRITAAVDKGVDLSTIELEEAAIARLNRLLLSAQIPISIGADGIRSLSARRGDGTSFDVAELSDGQRSALLLAAVVLTAEPGQVLLIDEPERHLHRAISAPLLRELFDERPDCAFVVATHEIDLAADHQEARVLLTRDYLPELAENGARPVARAADTWDLDWLEPGARLPEELRRDVLGARRRILFVEGTETSLDRPLYGILFPNVSVFPKGTASDVIAATKALRGDLPHWLEACGLIDRDERDHAAVEALLADSVHVLALNAVEALDLHPDVVRAIAVRQFEVVEGDPAEFAQAAIEAAVHELSAERDRLCARAIEVSVRNEVKSQLPTWQDLLRGDFSPVAVAPAGRLDAERAAFDAAVAAGDLVALLKRYKVRETGAAAAAARTLKFPKVSDYRSAVRRLLATDAKMRSAMRDLAPSLAARWPEEAG